MSTEDENYAQIRCYFADDVWAQLSQVEKRAYYSKRTNFEKMKELGLASQPPEFMRPRPAPPEPRPSRAKRPRAASADRDDEWSPSRYVRPARQRGRSTVRRTETKRTRFRPPVKKTKSDQTQAAPSSAAGKRTPTSTVTSQSGDGDSEEIRARSPSPPHDFIGFSLEEQYRARHIVDTRGEKLWDYITQGFIELGEEPPQREIFKRHRKQVNYAEEEDLDDDDYIFCDECDREWEGDCPVHGPLDIIPDNKVLITGNDPDRAEKTLPDFLSTGRSKIPDADTGIWTEKALPARQRFGPYEGQVTFDRQRATNSGYSWEIKKCRRVDHYVDAGDSSCSNWLRLVNCARFEHEQNLIAFQYKGQMYYRTYKDIPKGSELLVYYGDAYARELNINVQSFRKAPLAAAAGPFSSGAMQLQCGHCTYQCLSQHRLDRHVQVKHGHIGRNGRYKCEWCDYSTDDSYCIRRHRRTHTGERPFSCDICGKAFTTQCNLTCHRRTHTGERPYSCDVCGMAFSQESHLERHRRVHTGENVRVCDQCGAEFRHMFHYTTHMKSHNGVKAHKCDACSARFVTRTNLTRHMRTHTGERPYSCSFCQARFSNQSHMKKHVIAVHTHDYRHRCNRCGKGFVAPRELRRHTEKCLIAFSGVITEQP